MNDRYKMTKREQKAIEARSIKLKLTCNIDGEAKVESKREGT